MFTSELNSLDNLYSSSSPNHSSYFLHSDALQFHYQLCQIFLKKTGEQLHQQESKLMVQSQNLIQNLSLKENEKDICISTDSGSQQITSSLRESSSKSSLNALKRGPGIYWRNIEGKIAPYLLQIEQKCSPICLANIKTTIFEYKQLILKMWEGQARQGMLERKRVHFQREHQQNLILKQKLNSQHLKIQTMQCQIDCLKQKNLTILDYANKKLQEMMGSQKLIEINRKVYRELKNYLDDKEKNASARLQRAELFQKELLNHVAKILPEESCDDCCMMLRKIKDSLLKFKRHLESQGAQLQNMYNKYKKTIFSHKSSHSTL